jgi:hypothetical protein
VEFQIHHLKIGLKHLQHVTHERFLKGRGVNRGKARLQARLYMSGDRRFSKQND